MEELRTLTKQNISPTLTITTWANLKRLKEAGKIMVWDRFVITDRDDLHIEIFSQYMGNLFYLSTDHSGNLISEKL